MEMQAQLKPQVQIGNGPLMTPVFVGNLDTQVTELELYHLFSQAGDGDVVSLRVCRDLNSWKSLGFAYVNFGNPNDAEWALDHCTTLNGKPISVKYSHQDASVRRSGTGNIYIKNSDQEIDHKWLHETFSPFGEILSCKVAVDVSGQSNGYGFVQFASEESAQEAIEKLDGKVLNGKVRIISEQEREETVDRTKFTNVFVNNLSESMTGEDLKKIFGECGLITSAVVMRYEDRRSKCYGFVNFENAEDALKAVKSLNGKKDGDKTWHVVRAREKSERRWKVKQQVAQRAKEAVEESQDSKLFVNNLDVSVGDDGLNELFSSFGTITSCEVLRDNNCHSVGSGYVAFSTPEEASRALSEMNGKMIGNNSLYVAFAKIEDRGTQSQSAQTRPTAMVSSTTHIPMHTARAPDLQQQTFYLQPLPIPTVYPHPGFGIPPQHVPGMRHVGPFMSNMSFPLHQKVSLLPRHGPAAAPFQQVIQMSPGYYYPPVAVARGMVPAQHGISHHQPIPVAESKSASALAQSNIASAKLYAVVEQILEPALARNVTDMLLIDMGPTQVLQLLEDENAWKLKIVEALQHLRSESRQD